MSSINRAEYCISKPVSVWLQTVFADRLIERGDPCFESPSRSYQTDMTAKIKDKYDSLSVKVCSAKKMGTAEDIGKAVASLARETGISPQDGNCDSVA